MARDFKAEEELLDQWFDEQKEKLSEQYEKGLKALYETTFDEEEKKKRQKAVPADTDAAVKELQNKFITDSKKIRKRYQKRYDKLKAAEESFKRKKKMEKAAATPFRLIFRLTLLPAGKALVFIWKHATKGIKGASARVKKTVHDLRYCLRDWYLFRGRRPLAIIVVPTKYAVMGVMRPVGKNATRFRIWLIAKRKEAIKNTVGALTKAWDRVMGVYKKSSEFTAKYTKLYGEKWTKFQKSSSETFGFIFSPLIKLLAKFKKDETEPE